MSAVRSAGIWHGAVVLSVSAHRKMLAEVRRALMHSDTLAGAQCVSVSYTALGSA